jgi:hypothetical protein
VKGGVGRCFCYPNLELRDSAKAIVGLRPIIFGPGTLGRTWGTRPVYWVLLGHRHFSSSCGVQHEMLVQRAKKSPGAEAQILLDVYGPTKVVP